MMRFRRNKVMKDKVPQPKERIKEEPLFSDTFKEIFSQMTEGLKKDRTAAEYYLVVKAFCAFPPEGDFLDAKADKINAFFDNIKNTSKTNRGANYRLAVLKSVSKAVDEKLGTNYYSMFLGKKLDFPMEYEEKDFPTVSDVDKVLTKLSEKEEYGVFIAASLALKLSLSLKDICSLKRKMFGCDAANNSFIRFESERSGSLDRYVYVPDEIAKMIEDYVANSRSVIDSESYLIADKKGKPLSSRILHRELKAASEEAGVKNVTFQKLRNLSVAVELKNGASTESVAENLGVTTRWFFRFSHVLDKLEYSPVKYNFIEINGENLFSKRKENQ